MTLMDDKKIYNMNDQVKQGKTGEEKILQLLKVRHPEAKIEDVRNVQKYRTDDIDFVITLPSGQTKTIEVKTDSYTTGNFALEEWSTNPKNTDEFGEFIEDGSGSIGCFRKTKADYIYYYFSEWDLLFVMRTEPAQEWFEEARHTFERSTVYNEGYKGSIRKVLIGEMQMALGDGNIKEYKNITKEIENG